MTAAAGLLALLVGSAPAGAQTGEYGEESSAEAVVWTVALNLGSTALVAGIRAYSDDRPVLPAVRDAAAGSLLHVTGKALAGADVPGGILLGRSASSVGASITRNAFDGRTAFSCVSLPLGPLWLNGGGCRRPMVSLDAVTILAAVAGAHQGRLAVDESLATGAVVFRTASGDRPARQGWAMGGTVVVQEGERSVLRHRLRHEMIHVLQHDMLHLTVGRAAEDRLRSWLPEGLRPMAGRIDLGAYVAGGLLLSLTPLDPRPLLEREARVLDGN